MKRREFLIHSGAATLVAAGIPGEIDTRDHAAGHNPARALAQPDLTQEYRRLMRRRTLQIDRLRAYAKNGVFPINATYWGINEPFFVDAKGTACAVGHLMRLDGLEKEVAAIAKADNHVRIMDVVDGPVAKWLTTSGLTQEEAALIQPGYSFMEPERQELIVRETKRLQKHFAVVTAELEATTHQSLPVALQRWLDHARARKGTAGFLVVEPARASGQLINMTSKILQMRVTALRQNTTGAWKEMYRSQVEPVGGARDTYFVEWHAPEPVHAGAVRLITPSDIPPATI